jgi:hypothetical protein
MHQLIILLLIINLTLGIKLACSGSNFTCYVLEDGNVKCIGDNSIMQLGRPNTNLTVPPNTLIPFPSNITALACGDSHVSVIQGIYIKSWGGNVKGQTGTGTTTTIISPQQLGALSATPLDIFTGIDFTCVQENNPYVQCFGNNFAGQLGIGSTTTGLSPASPVSQSCVWQTLSTGGGHVLAKCATGIYAWGKNDFSQLGDGTTINKGTTAGHFPLPALPFIPSQVKQLSAALYHSCFLFINGSYACTGQGFGLTPVLYQTYNFTLLGSWLNTTCGITITASMYCWSSANPTPSLFNYFSTYTNIAFIPGVTSLQICILGIDVVYSNTVKRLVCYDTISSSVTIINPACGDNITQTSEGEECDPPFIPAGGGMGCSLQCKFIIIPVPTPSSTPLPPSPVPSSTNPASSSVSPSPLPQGLTPSPSISSSSRPIVNTNTSILTSVTVIGNFTLSPNTTLIIGAGTLIDVKGCANLAGNLTVLQFNVSNPFITADCINGTFDTVSFPPSPNGGKECNEGTVRVTAEGDRFAAFTQNNCSAKNTFPFWVIGVIVGFFVLVVVIVVTYAMCRVHSYSRYSVAFHKMEGEESL